MKIWLTVCFMAMAFSFPSTSMAEEEIGRLSLDDPAGLGLIVEKDPAVKVEGQASVKIVTKLPTTINLGEMAPLDLDNTRLIYKAQVKSDELKGTAYLEMWCFFGKNKYFSRGLNSVISGTADWKTLETPFFLKPGEKPDKIMLNIVINGQGTIWVDGVQVSKTIE